jgi:hypothetical protein
MKICETCGAFENQDCKNGENECDWIGISSDIIANRYTDQLKPCPLCGGKPHDSVMFCGLLRPGRYEVKCIVCNLAISNDRIDKVIDMWNRRV